MYWSSSYNTTSDLTIKTFTKFLNQIVSEKLMPRFKLKETRHKKDGKCHRINEYIILDKRERTDIDLKTIEDFKTTKTPHCF